MRSIYSDEGLILKKVTVGDKDLYVTIITKTKGKMTFRAYGVKKITSHRLSHLETGNYIRFTTSTFHDRLVIKETDLLWGYSNIRNNIIKIECMFTLFVILAKLLPEGQQEERAFTILLYYLKKLNTLSIISIKDFDKTLCDLLFVLGYVDQQTIALPLFNPIEFTENIMERKIIRGYFK